MLDEHTDPGADHRHRYAAGVNHGCRKRADQFDRSANQFEAPAVNQASTCEPNPSSAPMPVAEPYGMVPEVGRISVTLRYRIALDASMNEGEGGVSATAVTPEPLVQLGRAELPFTVSK